MPGLTTHVLDTVNGCPAAAVAVRLFDLSRGRHLVTSTKTNADGRTEEPLLDGDALETGSYELEFDIGAYFAASGAEVAEPPFLDTVVIRCSLRKGEKYHVPLLASPWSYSTYRGS